MEFTYMLSQRFSYLDNKLNPKLDRTPPIANKKVKVNLKSSIKVKPLKNKTYLPQTAR